MHAIVDIQQHFDFDSRRCHAGRQARQRAGVVCDGREARLGERPDQRRQPRDFGT
jgi:hypothetical protein